MGFTITSFGAMEAADNVLVHNLESGAVFTGDAVLNGHVYYLGEGHSALALRALGEISRRYPAATRAYPAHGDPGVLTAMIERDIAQIRFMRERVVEIAQHAGARTPDGRLSDRARARLVGTFAEHFRNWLSYGLDAATIAQMNLSGLEPEILGELDRAAEREATAKRP